jgi:hypothetical protein
MSNPDPWPGGPPAGDEDGRPGLCYHCLGHSQGSSDEPPRNGHKVIIMLNSFIFNLVKIFFPGKKEKNGDPGPVKGWAMVALFWRLTAQLAKPLTQTRAPLK